MTTKINPYCKKFPGAFIEFTGLVTPCCWLVTDKDRHDDLKEFMGENFEKAFITYPKEEIEAYWSVLYPLVMNLKWFYNRPRPYQLGAKYGMEIKYISTKTHQTPSYPSGHTSYGHLVSLVLSEKYPEFRTIMEEKFGGEDGLQTEIRRILRVAPTSTKPTIESMFSADYLEWCKSLGNAKNVFFFRK